MIQKTIYLLLIFFLVILETRAQTVNISSGPIQGKMNGHVYEFLGIPFATPPVGDLRWKAPKEPAEWQEVLNTTEFSPVCPQKKFDAGRYNFNNRR